MPVNNHGSTRPTRSVPSTLPFARSLAAVLLAVAALAATACSGAGPAPVATAPEPPPADPSPASEPPPAATAAGANDLPAVTVVNVVSGESLVLSSLAPADRPILLWFWAPH